MGRYFYRAIKDRKEVVTGYLEAKSQEDAKKRVVDMGFMPAGIYSEDKIPRELRTLTRNYIKNISLRDRMLFTSELQMLLDSGISTFEALHSLAEHAPSKKIAFFAADLLKKMKSGKTLSEALEDYYSILGNVYISLVRTGEESGELPSTLKYLTKLLRKQDELKGNMIHILIYPSILLAIMTIMFFLFGIFIFPFMMGSMSIPPSNAPVLVRFMVETSYFIVKYGLVILILGGGFLYTAGLFIGYNKIKRNIVELMLKIPILKDCIHYILLSHYVSVLYVAYESGVPMLKTLSLAQDTISVDSLKRQADIVTKSIEKGESLTDAFEKTYLLTTLMLSMVATGEKTGKLGQMFKDIATNIEEKLNRAISALSKAFEPTLLIVIGVGVGIMAISIIQMIITSFMSAF